MRGIERLVWVLLCAGMGAWASYLWVSRGYPSEINWGAVPDYAATSVAAIALSFAAKSALMAARQRDIMEGQLAVMRAELNEANKERVRGQAISVFFECTPKFFSGRDAVWVNVYNLSSSPIFDARLVVCEADQLSVGRPLGAWAVLPPTGSQGVLGGILVRTPSSVAQFGDELVDDGRVAIRVPIDWEMLVRLEFVDAVGHKWQRLSDFSLEETVRHLP